ncbi:helix-turn-helix transcriptional regulator [Jidongwangia harbinensis]|uniref:helix-turn-helix transcriptional regulator n=1 Tax=Jidongwangia harbinensis TaxID=2878561 RepID=UPI001CDA515D|nr:LuxR family transcriptional regulator [Jidongwangia harbinensis]MCA2216962.1 AAA family ATPase [Jidongwangia harbinensis]
MADELPDAEGRVTELAAIGGFLDTLPGGATALVLNGEAGMGKTTLWHHGVANARARGYRVLLCRPAEAEAALTLSALGDLLDGVLDLVAPDLPAPQVAALEVALLCRAADDPPWPERALAAATLSAVRALARSGPVLLAVDDAQWVDEASCRLLSYLARRLADEPVGLLATRRTESPAPPPFGLAAALPAGRLTSLSLGPLDLPSLRRVLLARTGLEYALPELRMIHHSAGGNPLNAVEIALSLQRAGHRLRPGEPPPVPEPVIALLCRRIRALPEPVFEALRYAALLAQPTLGTVRAALGVPDGAVSPVAPAEEAGIVQVTHGRIRFSHPLYSSAVRALTSTEHGQRAHRRLTAVVTDVEQRARHLALSNNVPDAGVAALLEQGAEQAWRRGSSISAAELWRLAAVRTPAADLDDLHRRNVAAAECLFAAGDAAGAQDLLRAVVTGCPADRLRSRALLKLAEVTFYQGSAAEAAELCRAALATVADDPQLTAELHLRLAWFSSHDAGGQLASAEAAVAALHRPGAAPEPAMLACALAVRGVFRLANGGGIARDDFDRAARLLPARPTRHWADTWGRQMLGTWEKYADPVAARARFALELHLATEFGDEPAMGHALMHLSEIDCWLGDWARAATGAERSIQVIELTGQRHWLGHCWFASAQVAAHQGAVDTAEDTARRALARAREGGDPYQAALLLQVLGFIGLSVGDPERAAHHLGQAADLVDGMRRTEPVRHMFHGDQVEAAIATGRLAEAHRLLDRLRARAAVARRPWLLVVLNRGAAAAAAAEGDLHSAARAAGRSLEVCDALPMPFERGRSLLVQGRILRAGRQWSAARASLGAAKRVFDELGAPLWSAQAEVDLSRCGQHRAETDQLTPTEERIRALVATGLTNVEVAGRLSISAKTVEANLTRIYRKLGVRNRSELAGLADSHRRSGDGRTRRLTGPGVGSPVSPSPRRR